MVTSNIHSLPSPAVLKPAEVAVLLRSVAMLPPGCPSALDRDTAYAVLSQLEELQGRRREAPTSVVCPYCGEGFDTAHGRRGFPRRTYPPRHPDPIGAADTVGGADQAARALAKALVYGNDDLRGPQAFWVDFGRCVLWPLLYLARATGRDMDDVRLLVHPLRAKETLDSVDAALKALDPTVDAERASRQWARIVATDHLSQNTAFRYAYGLVGHWEFTGAWNAPDKPLAGESGEEPGREGDDG